MLAPPPSRQANVISMPCQQPWFTWLTAGVSSSSVISAFVIGHGPPFWMSQDSTSSMTLPAMF
jgi:hypothetical protein